MKKSLYIGLAVVFAIGLLVMTGPPVAMASDILSAIHLAKADAPEFNVKPYDGDIQLVIVDAGSAIIGDPGSAGLMRSTTALIGIVDTPAPSSLVMIGGVSFGTGKEPRFA